MPSPTILVGTPYGCRVFLGGEEQNTELSDRRVFPLAAGENGTCLAVVDDFDIYRRFGDRHWTWIATAPIALQSLTEASGVIFCGAADQAAVLRVDSGGAIDRLTGFDAVPGRNEWFAGGPPLGVRSLMTTADARTLCAAVHVGGVPRSEDGGKTWLPTMPVRFDVHELCSHSSDPALIAASTAVGLCVSRNGGRSWDVLDEGLDIRNSLSVGALDSEFLFGICDGPFAKRSQLWRWTIGSLRVDQVIDGLPHWLEGKLDTCQIAGGRNCAALVDGGGTLWFSNTGSNRWAPVAKRLPFPSSVLLVA